MAELIDLAWDAYATPRWKPGTNTERIASGDGGRKSCSFRTHAEASVRGNAYGVDSLGIVWDVEPSAQMAQNFVIENVMVCCAMCAAGKGSLNGDE